MALEVDIPVEIKDYKRKIIGALSGRQLVSLVAAAGIGLIGWFVSRNVVGLSMSNAGNVVMVLATIPLAIGFLSIDGRPLEEYMSLMLRHYFDRAKLPLRITVPVGRRSIELVKQRKKERKNIEADVYEIKSAQRARRRKSAAKAIATASKEYRRQKRLFKKAAKAERSAK